MAGMMYDSLHDKLLKLDDDVEVYPAHGAGSMCGKNLSKETSSTIGQQRNFNYALQPMSKEHFVKMMTTDLPEAPAYFSKDAEINRSGAAALTGLPHPAPLSPAEVSKLAAQGSVILDVRSRSGFWRGSCSGRPQHRTRRPVCVLGRFSDSDDCTDRHRRRLGRAS